jgi:hypothetical protein
MGFFLFLFMVKAGGLLVQRERARLRTDLTAYSAGVAYARALNVLADIQQISGYVKIGQLIPYVGYFFKPAASALENARKLVTQSGPYIVESAAAYIGQRNGLAAVPLWNVKELVPGARAQSFAPSFNLQDQTASGSFNESVNKNQGTGYSKKETDGLFREQETRVKDQVEGWGQGSIESMLKKYAPGMDLSSVLETTGYSYQPESGGKRVRLPTDDVKTGPERKRGGGTAVRHHQKGTGKYVAEDKGLKLSTILGTDDGEHYITLIAPMLPSWTAHPQPGQPWIWSLSQVQVSGGNQNYFGTDGAEYGAYFVPVRIELGLDVEMPGAQSLQRSTWDEQNTISWTKANTGPAEKGRLMAKDFKPLLDALPIKLDGAAGVLNTIQEILAVQH